MTSTSPICEPHETDRVIGGITVLTGAENGKYPDGNAVIVSGTDRTVMIDPSLTVHDRGGAPAAIDQILISHAHEDHVAGLHLFPDTPVLAHELDLFGVQTIDGLLDVYGFDDDHAALWRDELIQEFHVTDRPDAASYTDGEVFDLGGRTITVVHLPGHTKGHCGFLIEPEGFFFIGDVDLTGFGPYYGDAWSDLEDFERTLEHVGRIDAAWFGTFHHKGLIEGTETFRELLGGYGAVIQRREDALLEFLVEPRTLDDVVAHRFIYRPTVESNIVDPVERRSMGRHIDRLLPSGRVVEVEPGRYRRG